jgi:hypothetical protein
MSHPLPEPSAWTIVLHNVHYATMGLWDKYLNGRQIWRMAGLACQRCIMRTDESSNDRGAILMISIGKKRGPY